MQKAWAFYRRSTDKQELSVEDQRRECRELADRMGLAIVQEFMPLKGWGSGLTIDHDPAFQDMIRQAEAGGHGVTYLIVYDVSRFGRLQPEDKIYWERRFKKQGGIQLVYVKDDFKNDGSIGDVLTRVVKHSEAHQFSMKLSEVVLRGAKSHAGLGHSVGGAAPYGYDRQLVDAAGKPVQLLQAGQHKADKTQRVVFLPNRRQAAVVLGVFKSYLNGNGLNRLVNDLNERQVPPPRGRHWSKGIVHYMLRNRTYVGERIYNKRSYKAYRRGERGSLFNAKDQWITKADAHPAIVPREIYERVQAQLTSKVITQGRSFHRPYLLSGLAICGQCGYRMVGMRKCGRHGIVYNSYTCSGYLRSGKSVCRSVNVSRDEIEAVALEAVRAHLADDTWRKDLVPHLESLVQQHFGGSVDARLAEVRDSLVDVERKIANVVRAVEAGSAADSLVESLTRLEAQRKQLQDQLLEAEAAARTVSDPDELLADMMETADHFDRSFAGCENIEQQKTFIRRFIEQVKVDHSPTEIKAHVSLYAVPQMQQTLALTGLHRSSLGSIAGVEFGPKWNLVKSFPLKRPEAFHRRRVA